MSQRDVHLAGSLVPAQRQSNPPNSGKASALRSATASLDVSSVESATILEAHNNPTISEAQVPSAVLPRVALKNTSSPRHDSASATNAGSPKQAKSPSGDGPLGAQLGKYRILAVLGRGGSGVVYEAVDTVLQRPVAVKILNERLAKERETLGRFLAEARVAARIQHPNTVGIYEIDSRDGLTYIVMELVRGGSAADFLKARGPFPWREATRITADVCRGLMAAHQAGVIHRDIKPANIMRSRRDGCVKLADFGLAEVGDRLRDTSMETSARSGPSVLGTPQYMSPEQCLGHPLDGRSDIYSLGATYFALLTATPPYPEAHSPLEVMASQVNGAVPDPRNLVGRVPAACSVIVARAMAKSPHDRFASVGEMLLALEAVIPAVEATPTIRPDSSASLIPLGDAATTRASQPTSVSSDEWSVFQDTSLGHSWTAPNKAGRRPSSEELSSWVGTGLFGAARHNRGSHWPVSPTVLAFTALGGLLAVTVSLIAMGGGLRSSPTAGDPYDNADPPARDRAAPPSRWPTRAAGEHHSPAMATPDITDNAHTAQSSGAAHAARRPSPKPIASTNQATPAVDPGRLESQVVPALPANVVTDPLLTPPIPVDLLGPWPGTDRGLMFVWRDRWADNIRWGGKPCQIMPRGKATPTPMGTMGLSGGAFRADDLSTAALLRECRLSHQLTIEAEITPARLLHPDPVGYVLGLAHDDRRVNFALTQIQDCLALTLRTNGVTDTADDTPNAHGLHSLLLRRLTGTHPLYVQVTYKPGWLYVWINGTPITLRPPTDGPLPTGDFTNWEDCDLMFGDTPLAPRPWRGQLRYVAIFARAISPAEASARFGQYRDQTALHHPLP